MCLDGSRGVRKEPEAWGDKSARGDGCKCADFGCCARCCLVKLEEEEVARIHYTDLGCTLLDAKTCRCRDYKNRQKKVADCVRLTPEAVRTLSWLPVTCAYRVLAEGKDLAPWHPLVSGDPNSVHEAGVSVRGRVKASEDDVPSENWVEHIVKWPNRNVRAKK